MPLSDVLILTGIVAAFALFTLALAWGVFQTRNLARHGIPSDRDENAVTKKAA
jgi:multisubunit Na+/H+ antiporter MnhC subunit